MPARLQSFVSEKRRAKVLAGIMRMGVQDGKLSFMAKDGTHFLLTYLLEDVSTHQPFGKITTLIRTENGKKCSRILILPSIIFRKNHSA